MNCRTPKISIALLLVVACGSAFGQPIRPAVVGGVDYEEPYVDRFYAGYTVGVIEFDIRSIAPIHRAILEMVPDRLDGEGDHRRDFWHVQVLAYIGDGEVSVNDRIRELGVIWHGRLALLSTMASMQAEPISGPAVLDVTRAVAIAQAEDASYIGFAFDFCWGYATDPSCPTRSMSVWGENAPDGTAYNNFLLRIEPRTGDPLRIVRTWPPDGFVDVRHDLSIGSNTQAEELLGIDRVTISFNLPVRDAVTGAAVSAGSFDVAESSPDRSPSVVAISELSVTAESSDVDFVLHLHPPISPGVWTTITANVVDEHGNPIQPGTGSVIFGFLPGDVDRSGVTNASDILFLIDVLNGVEGRATDPLVCDIDRSDDCNATDILQLIDLLNGVGTSRSWNNVGLLDRPW